MKELKIAHQKQQHSNGNKVTAPSAQGVHLLVGEDRAHQARTDTTISNNLKQEYHLSNKGRRSILQDGWLTLLKETALLKELNHLGDLISSP